MPVHIRKKRRGEGGKLWKIVNVAGGVEGESDRRMDAEASARIRNRAHKKKK